MEGSSFAVQMVAPKMYWAEAPKDGGEKGIYDDRSKGAQWKEIEVPDSGMKGHFGGVAELYELIAKGKGKEEVSCFLSAQLSNIRVSPLPFPYSHLLCHISALRYQLPCSFTLTTLSTSFPYLPPLSTLPHLYTSLTPFLSLLFVPNTFAPFSSPTQHMEEN